MRRLLVLGLLVVVGCKQPTPTPIVPEDTKPLEAAPAPPPVEPPSAPVTRLRGPLTGGFTLEKSSFLAAEPIFATLHVVNAGPTSITFDVGGDYRGSFYPIRYGILVHDATGKKVCDNRDPVPMSLGGISGPRKLATGEALHEVFAINSACDLFAPGAYKLTLIRILTAQHGADGGVHCDDMMARETPPPGTSPSCGKLLDTAPLVATDLSIEIKPYDQKALARALDSWVSDAKAYKDIGDKWHRTLYMQWLSRRVTCSFAGAPLSTVSDVAPYMRTVIGALPPAPPKPCP